MARLPARAQKLDEVVSLDDAYARMISITGSLRNVLRLFKDQTARGQVPSSHILDRLLEPLAASRAQLSRMQAVLTSADMVAYARNASADRDLDTSVDVPAFLAALDRAGADIKAAVPRLFDADGAFINPLVQDADGRPVSKSTLTSSDQTALNTIADQVLALIAE